MAGLGLDPLSCLSSMPFVALSEDVATFFSTFAESRAGPCLRHVATFAWISGMGREMLCRVATFAKMFGALSAEPPQGSFWRKIQDS
jgi:hypothetical protein